MHDPQLETQHSRQAPSALLRLSPPPPTSPPTLDRRETSASSGSGIPELAHDARNLISALDLYCELLTSPGVLAPGFQHYAEDLRRLAGSGAKLIEALAGSQTRTLSRYPHRGHSPVVDHGAAPRRPLSATRCSNHPFPCIDDLASELAALEAPLRALAGPNVRLEIECAPCAGRLALTSEKLLRILFNLVANAVEAMAATPPELRRRPFLRITAQRGGGGSFAAGFPSDLPDRHTPQGGGTVVLSVRDNGPGIAPSHIEHIFDAGFSTRHSDDRDESHGLGLAIVRQLATAAGGAVRAVSPAGRGARFDIELPVLRPEAVRSRPGLVGSLLKGKIPNLQQISAQIEKEA
jgi:signal transduction histidine kinase